MCTVIVYWVNCIQIVFVCFLKKASENRMKGTYDWADAKLTWTGNRLSHPSLVPQGTTSHDSSNCIAQQPSLKMLATIQYPCLNERTIDKFKWLFYGAQLCRSPIKWQGAPQPITGLSAAAQTSLTDKVMEIVRLSDSTRQSLLSEVKSLNWSWTVERNKNIQLLFGSCGGASHLKGNNCLAIT